MSPEGVTLASGHVHQGYGHGRVSRSDKVMDGPARVAVRVAVYAGVQDGPGDVGRRCPMSGRGHVRPASMGVRWPARRRVSECCLGPRSVWDCLG